MYVVGRAYDPKDNNGDCWTLQIHNINEKSRLSHWACIMVYASTLDLCLLEAKAICDILNSHKFQAQVTIVNGLTDKREEWKRKHKK